MMIVPISEYDKKRKARNGTVGRLPHGGERTAAGQLKARNYWWDQSPKPSVYFVRAGKHGAVKIGHATNLTQRISMIQCGNADTIMCEAILRVGTVEDARRLERAIHKRVPSALHLRGEWFSIPREDIAAICDWAAAQFPDMVIDRWSADFDARPTEVEADIMAAQKLRTPVSRNCR